MSDLKYCQGTKCHEYRTKDRINTIREHLTDKEVMWVMSLLTFEKLLDIVKDSQEFGKYTSAMKERTVH